MMRAVTMKHGREPRTHELMAMAENLITHYPSLMDPVNPLTPCAPRVGDLNIMLICGYKHITL